MAIEDFGGSVLGQKIELVMPPITRTEPDLAGPPSPRRWYDAEGVDMITDLTDFSVALAVQRIAAEKKTDRHRRRRGRHRRSPARRCTPYGFHWLVTRTALAVSTGGALVKTGGDTWFFVTVDTLSVMR